MNIQLVLANDQDDLAQIKQIMAYTTHNLGVNHELFQKTFDRIAASVNKIEPLFMISKNQNTQQINIIYSIHPEYRFLFCLSKGMFIQKLYSRKQTTEEEILNFQHTFVKRFHPNYVNVTLKTPNMKVQNYPQLSTQSLILNGLTLNGEQLQKYRKKQFKWQDLENFKDYTECRYFKVQDYHLGLNELLKDYTPLPNFTEEQLIEHYKLMKSSNIEHIAFSIVDKRINKLIGFGILLIRQTLLYGKTGFLSNVVVCKEQRNKGLGQAICLQIIQQGLNRDCKQFKLECGQKLSIYYGKFGFKIDQDKIYVFLNKKPQEIKVNE